MVRKLKSKDFNDNEIKEILNIISDEVILQQEEETAELAEGSINYMKDDFKKLVSISQKIEGIKRHIGIHAAGLLISKDDMTNYVPFTKSAKNVVAT
ncbi:MAG: hypothetical protein LBD88_02665, partial [Candidatus Peribacteria bacterium]|nr:hypothetical protein [Candidatus Peribacteria bacterium]